MSWVVRIKNHPLFDDVEITVKPITVFVGKNASGKGTLMRLLWLLFTSAPDARSWIKHIAEADISGYLAAVDRKAEKAEDISEELVKLTKIAIETFPQSIGESFSQRFKETFGADPEPRGMHIEVESRAASSGAGVAGSYGIKLYYDESSGAFKAQYSDPEPFRKLADLIQVRSELDGIYEFYFNGVKVREKPVLLSGEAIYDALGLARFALRKATWPWFSLSAPLSRFHSEFLAVFYADGRAGLTDVITLPWISLSELDLSPTERELAAAYHYVIGRLHSKHQAGELRLDLIRDALTELGVVDIRPGVKGDSAELYVKLWNNVEVPLEQAPSSVKEILLPLLSLTIDKIRLVAVEEPEAHLHPGALVALTKTIARAANKMDKIVMLSTHSDTLFIKLEHLVKASKLSKAKLDTLGLEKDEVLQPDKVAVYVLKRDVENRRVAVEPIKVTSKGFIGRDGFSEVFDELINEGSLIEIAREPSHRLAGSQRVGISH